MTKGATHRVAIGSARSVELASLMPTKTPPDLSRFLMCPMPGLITQLHVNVGDRVDSGQHLAVVEAMKMENSLRAAKSGVVSRLAAAPGDTLVMGQVILEIE